MGRGSLSEALLLPDTNPINLVGVAIMAFGAVQFNQLHSLTTLGVLDIITPLQVNELREFHAYRRLVQRGFTYATEYR